MALDSCRDANADWSHVVLSVLLGQVVVCLRGIVCSVQFLSSWEFTIWIARFRSRMYVWRVLVWCLCLRVGCLCGLVLCSWCWWICFLYMS